MQTPDSGVFKLRSDSRLQTRNECKLQTTASGDSNSVVTPDYKLRRDYRLRKDYSGVNPDYRLRSDSRLQPPDSGVTLDSGESELQTPEWIQITESGTSRFHTQYSGLFLEPVPADSRFGAPEWIQTPGSGGVTPDYRPEMIPNSRLQPPE